jgi:ArsR family transcriptional regulator
MNDPARTPSTPSAAALEGGSLEVDEIAAVAKALGHPIRVRIVRILLAQDACICGEIVDQLPVAQATVSQHLKILKDAGLVRGEIDGPRVCYCVDHAALDRHQALLASLTAGVAPVSCGPEQLAC